ncbi:kinase-like protein [Rhizodiscina lignyota]|uniref:Kinase-like protein n=1 Tax=Rhizodiscina lignyota TaxID=1504668 RepID=A0A9P4I7Y6_9PEZI|nr:kinase-like protein [Rhizodiscina lignyota]
MAITSTEDLKQYLKSKNVLFESIEELSGGTANFVFRMREPSGRSVVIKHAEPYIKTRSSFPFPVERMDFEANALRTVSSHLPQDDIVNAAEVYSYDSEAHVIMMSDGGSRDLKTAYSDPALDVVSFGNKLGRWLAMLHSRTTKVDIGDNTIAKNIYRWSSKHLAGALEKYGFDKSLGDTVNEEYGLLLATDDVCVCHGDFWPGNVLVGSDGKLTIVDWEMVRRGTGATDVGQFAAETWLLDRFRGGRGMLDAFLKGYMEVSGGKPSKEFAKRVVVHWGTHIAYWPTSVQWGDKEETRNVVDIGRENIVKAMENDWEWLRHSPLGLLIS